MKRTFLYCGYIEITHIELESIFKIFFDESFLKFRYASDIEKEVKYKDENLEVYAYEDFYDGYKSKGYLFQAELNGTFSEASNFINELSSRLRNKATKFDFQWSEYDEKGNEIGEEFEIEYSKKVID